MKTPFILTALEAYQDVQNAIPHAHIGGSVGLFLHGIVLPRDWYNGPLDLDVTIQQDLGQDELVKYAFMSLDNSDLGSGMDMQYRFMHNFLKIKIEMQTDPDSESTQISYKNFVYRVKTIGGIMFWKHKWADECEKTDEEKHRRDLAYLEKGYTLINNIYKPIDF